MPHKKVKRSAREERRKQQCVLQVLTSAQSNPNERGSNLAPGKGSISSEAIPKSAARIINALKIREDYRRKRKSEQKGDDDKTTHKRRRTEDAQLKIRPGESIHHFYRRVEDDMRPTIRSAIQSSQVRERTTRKILSGSGKKESAWNQTARSVTDRRLRGQSPTTAVAALGSKSKESNEDAAYQGPKEFAQLSSSAPRRLNDIAQRPPEMKEMPWSAKCVNFGAQREGILSMAQRSMMEQEREKAIARYRVLKASRLQEMKNK